MKIPRLWAQDFLAIFQISELDTTTTHNNCSDVVGEQKSGLGQVRVLLFWVGSGSGINISGMSTLGFGGFIVKI